jgi:GNAT superfamily N-acetyltransferase
MRENDTTREGEIPIRQATPADIEGISHVRLSVRENATTPQRLAALGITPAGVAASLVAECRGWVAEDGGRIVAFSIADGATGSVFALFVLPDYEGRGLGRRLLACAVQWLWDQHADTLWLSTDPGTRAARFYERAGWQLAGMDVKGELRFELRRVVS